MLPTDDKARKALPLWTFLMEYFPDAFVAVAKVAITGNNQHNPGRPLHWARDKSTDQMNTAFRHMFDHGQGVVMDTDGVYHLAKAIWRLSAELQLLIEKGRLGPVEMARPTKGPEERADPVADRLADFLANWPINPRPDLIPVSGCDHLEKRRGWPWPCLKCDQWPCTLSSGHYGPCLLKD